MMPGRTTTGFAASTGPDNRTYKRDREGRFSSTGGGSSPEEFDAAVAGAVTGRDALAVAALRTPPTAAEAAAIETYGSGSTTTLNGGLRTGGGDLSTLDPADRNTVAGLDSAMASASLGADVVVHRRAKLGDVFGAHAEGDLTGLEWKDDGFVSTSVTSRSGTARMRILVPKGTRGLSDDYVLDPDEILLDRGLTFRVVRDEGRGGDRRLDVEVLG